MTHNFYRRAATMAAILVLVSVSSTPAAHELGTTRVSARFADDGRYGIEITTDATALVEKLRASRGDVLPVERDASGLQHSLRSLDASFRQRVALAFDGVAVAPAVDYSVAPGGEMSPPLATIRLSGAVPAGARQASWTYGWTFVSYAMTVWSPGSDRPVTQWLEGARDNGVFAVAAPAPSPTRLRTAARYLALGFTHIVPGGLDHVLFVVGIFLLSRRLRSVLWQVTAFTIAHSITLGLSMTGVLAVSPSIVEPLIAVSIAYVAIENLCVAELTSRRIGLVFGFGLLHGMGFAGVLQELGLPRGEFVTALVAFNLGVEAGQVAVLGLAFLLVGRPWAGREWYRRRVVIPVSVVIACAAVYWMFERLAAAPAITRTVAFIVG